MCHRTVFVKLLPFSFNIISSAVDNVMDAEEDLYVEAESEWMKRIQSKDQGGTTFAQE